MEGWNYWKEKKVFIILKNKRQYSGVVIGIEENTPSTWLILLDKYDNRVQFNVNEIETIEEEK